MPVAPSEATPAAPDYQPPAGSLDEAAMRFASLLSPPEEKEPPQQPQPEQPSRPAETAEQAQPAATKADEAEAREAAEPEEPEDAQPVESAQPADVFTVRIDGEDVQVPRDELLRGYSRNADYTRKTMALSEERKTLDQTKREILAERQQYLTLLPELKKLIADASAEPNWSELATQLHPAAFAERVQQWKANQDRVKQVETETQRVSAMQQQEAERGFQEMLRREKDLLETALPDLKDPEKGKRIQSDLSDYARRQSFTDEELGQVTDHRLVLLLHKAMLYDKQQAQAPKIQSKIEKALAPAAPGNRTPAPKPSKLAEAQKRLRTNGGKLDDAAAAIAALLE